MAASCKDESGLQFAKQGSKLHSKMLSKEASAQLAAPSFRVYYSVASAGAVPFLWESQPGTPKNDSASASVLPPLTPPPSYYASSKSNRKAAGGGGGYSGKRRGAFFGFLRRPAGRTAPCSSSSMSWSSSSSSSSSTMSPVFTVRSSSPRAPGPATFFDDADDARCFAGMEHSECCERGMVKGCSVVGAVRNALATVVGGGRRA